MSSLKQRIEWLERELPPHPPRFKIHEDLPFAILRYDPREEWEMRREVARLSTRLGHAGVEVVSISLAELLWGAIESSEGLDAVVRLERERGFATAEKQVNTYLSDHEFSPLPSLLSERLSHLDPGKNLCFLVRAASLGPSTYFLSKLLEEMQGRTRVPTILCYPGSVVGTNGLCFMNLTHRDAIGNYRVKIYG